MVMRTKILRGMLYMGSEMLKEVPWIIFDEIHYIKDRERGVIWEESIIFLPSVIKIVFLSETMSNATEFAAWIYNLHKQPCHVVYTDFRSTPLQYYVFPIGGSRLYLVIDENGQFKEDNFVKVQDKFAKPKKQDDGNKSQNANSSGKIVKNGTSSGGSDIYKIMIMEQKFLLVIIFSFSRRECEQHAMSISKIDFNAENEKDVVKQIYENKILSWNEEDKNFPAIKLMLSLLQRGIVVQHSGLLPIIKEVVELLFQEGLVKALFATETALPDIGERVSKLEKEAAILDASGETSIPPMRMTRRDFKGLDYFYGTSVPYADRVFKMKSIVMNKSNVPIKDIDIEEIERRRLQRNERRRSNNICKGTPQSSKKILNIPIAGMEEISVLIERMKLAKLRDIGAARIQESNFQTHKMVEPINIDDKEILANLEDVEPLLIDVITCVQKLDSSYIRWGRVAQIWLVSTNLRWHIGTWKFRTRRVPRQMWITSQGQVIDKRTNFENDVRKQINTARRAMEVRMPPKKKVSSESSKKKFIWESETEVQKTMNTHVSGVTVLEEDVDDCLVGAESLMTFLSEGYQNMSKIKRLLTEAKPCIVGAGTLTNQLVAYKNIEKELINTARSAIEVEHGKVMEEVRAELMRDSLDAFFADSDVEDNVPETSKVSSRLESIDDPVMIIPKGFHPEEILDKFSPGGFAKVDDAVSPPVE
ncbi:hypothetical protein GIB67_013509 [Kingdonia uniflora]|uniref:Helicase ATP-binding domain-containing protein n=1 Tax=Kingdonia uniflora TaxID=39325 RepID=A0A7J7KUW6_9MAGN|nr:hypothetical protein GIB67_013509 [Kingdonia uniflora]